MDFVHTVGWFFRQNGVKAFAIVPKRAPVEFVTVELTGLSAGSVPGVLSGTLAVQCWADTEQAAAALLKKCRRIILGLPDAPGSFVESVRVNSAYSWPDPEGAKYRYQMVVSLFGYDQE